MIIMTRNSSSRKKVALTLDQLTFRTIFHIGTWRVKEEFNAPFFSILNSICMLSRLGFQLTVIWYGLYNVMAIK